MYIKLGTVVLENINKHRPTKMYFTQFLITSAESHKQNL
jgi:hypothetical protein